MATTWRIPSPLISLWALCGPLFGFAQSPHVAGTFTVDVTRGRLAGDVCVSRLPTDSVSQFVLNRGLNIREVRLAGGDTPIDFSGLYNAVGVGDGTRYTLDEPGGEDGFCVEYIGAYPVYDVDAGERFVGDWKGQITFDGKTVRAAEQTHFYPVVELDGGTQLVAVTYDVTVECPGCASIYFNGSAPTAGPTATFTSEVPRQLLLYAGDFPFSEQAGVYFVGADADPRDAAIIDRGLQAIADHHADYIGVPYRTKPTLLSFASVSRDRELGRASWGFVTWPTIAFDGRTPFTFLVDADSASDERRFADSRRPFLGHELAHHYFGSRYEPQGPLRWFLLESTAEFLALLSLRAMGHDSIYQKRIANHYRSVVNAGEIVPLNEIDTEERIGGGYRYTLGPLLLLTMEERLGVETVRGALASLVTDPPKGPADYGTFRDRLERAGAPANELESFEDTCLVPKPWESCIAGLDPDRRRRRTGTSG